ncbi:MAG: tyrosine-type recombinase/integrase [Burkholderiales bacterium]|nr:tyrosine-type recombinase/integrase [Burkholderiales bacterium]
MRTHHPDNERIKRQYFVFLKEAKGQSEDSVDAVAQAIARFEADTQYRDFKAFHFEQAVAFKRRLADRDSRATGDKLSKATQYATLAHLKRFFQWLALQPGYRSKLRYSDAEYFSFSDKDSRVAKARRTRPVPTLEQVKHAIATMPVGSVIERRNRALLAFALLTGARDSALASMKLKHVDLAAGSVFQDAREVMTKFSKTFTTFFFPVGAEVRQIVDDWVQYLRRDLLWGHDDPLFPATRVELGTLLHFEAVGLERKAWSTAAPIRAVFKSAFEAAGLPYYNPHSLRSTLVHLGERLCQTPEEFKAWSQNLGHEGVLTTFYSYGSVAPPRQSEIIAQLGKAEAGGGRDPGGVVSALVRTLKAHGAIS